MGNENSSSYESDAVCEEPRFECELHPIKVSFDLGALEEGTLHSKIYNSLSKSSTAEEIPPPSECVENGNLVDISELVRTNSFMAFNKKDADSLVLQGEALDFIGDFPYLCDETEVESFEQLFRFIAERDFQLVTIDNDEFAILSIFAIRPKIQTEK